MNEKIKTICLIIITIAILISAIFHCLITYEKQKYSELQRVEKCKEITSTRWTFSRCMLNDFEWVFQENTGLEELLEKYPQK